jgi:hypothetical protein
VKISSILELRESPERTAALAEWLQSLYADDPPILVGGSAVELYTGGAYRSGDLDFVGSVPGAVADALVAAGFRRSGRHWVHEGAQVFLEFPGSTLHIDDEVVDVRVGASRVRAISPEALLVDRLAAWQHWKSAEDAVNAWLLWRAMAMRTHRLQRFARKEGVEPALRELLQAAKRWRGTEPRREELEEWARRLPGE